MVTGGLASLLLHLLCLQVEAAAQLGCHGDEPGSYTSAHRPEGGGSARLDLGGGNTMKAFLKSPDGILALRPKITTIGRHEDSDIILKSLGIEEHHAAIEFSDSENSFILRDFNSTHGTFVNDCHIQNAAVKVSPGDILRFGSNGTAFELVLENGPQVSRPPVSRRVAWPGQLHLVTEAKPPSPVAASQFPSLQSQRSPPISRSWSYGGSGTLPHPPLRKRPVNAWGRPVASPSFSPDAFIKPSAPIPGSGAAIGPLTTVHQGDAFLKERDEVILKMGNEISRLSGFESECSRKDTVIANLQNEIAMMTEKMMAALAKKDAEFHQKLVDFEQDVSAKTKEIKALKEEVCNLQSNTSEVLYHSLSERDLQIAHWKQETEALKKSYSLTTGLVTSLQKDITSKDHNIQQLKIEVEKFRRESREKDNQLAQVSAQCARIKEEMKREFREREVNAYQNQISELELQVKRYKQDINKFRTEHGMLTNKLAEKTKAEGDLKKECERRSQQLQEMGRRERLIKSDLELAATQAQRFRHQLSEALFSQLPEKALTDQQIVEKIEEIQVNSEEYCQREALLKEELLAKNSEIEEVSKNVELLKKALDGLQDFLGTSYCSSSLRKEICNLQNLCLTPPALGVQTSTAGVLCSLLGWVDAVECLLRDVGLDVSGSEKGMASYMKKLLGKHHETMAKLQTLQNQLKMAEMSQDSLLQEKLNELKEKLEEQFQDRERELQENEKVLEGLAALEEAKLKEAIDEEKKKVRDLEAQMKRSAEVIELKTKSEEALNAKIKKALESLEEATRRKTVAEEKLTVWEKRLKSIENENEMQKQKHQEEITEYKEQIKQHSKTIVDLENKFVEAVQKLKEENAKLQKQIEDMQRESCKLLPAHPPEVPCPEGSDVFLKEGLAAAKHEIVSNQAVISELKKELSEARARVSDVIGELSEKQKMELEQKRHLVHSQAHELNQLREKLFEMSKLVDQKDADLKAQSEELRNIRGKLQKLATERKEKADEPKKIAQHKSVQTRSSTPDEAPTGKKVSSVSLADLGARCKGSRHEEIISRQKGALAELRQRVRMLERGHPLGFEERIGEPLRVLKKGPAEKGDERTEKEQVTTLMTAADANQLQSSVSRTDPNLTIERTAKLEMADALDLSENMYLNLIQDLANLVNVKELTGMQTVKHLPYDEREKLGVRRQKDLGLLFDKIRKLKDRLERKESLLKEYERDVGQFRTNKQTLQACQSELAKLADKIYREAEEKALLKEALERTKLQLTQEKKLNRALKQHKNQLEERKSEISSCYACTLKFRDSKAAAPKKPFPEKQVVAGPGAACKKRVHCSTSA
ncbi:forkhead-associated domain-containing protein 1 [Podarcis raffonei]|uniref:forkhead-associated domain-containing protein 1 n=1 Tax=Podarcis raffonei TaxID=65483 RepID=UPI0023298D19|nr:forkhead-associated domain-containing protein 1 [Podarcis raffonei]